MLREALALGRHFLGDAALPGALLGAAGGDAPAPARRRPADDDRRAVDDHRALRAAASLLDERERLDVDALRAFFTARVIGQPEAVECMVERVALLKAGLTDPTRPQAVLLFVGPTGTGKTEIAKALAEYLFGSPRPHDPARHERVPEPGLRAADARRRRARRRVAGRRGSGASRSRVVLLDEFEKAEPGVFDLFLQVFDDGRLSDPRGEPADFRHAVIIMTSNLGAKVVTGGLGFSPATGFAEAQRRRRRSRGRSGPSS